MTRRIPVGPFPHYYAIVDDEDYEYLSQFTWCVLQNPHHRTVYAKRSGDSVRMHKLLTGWPRTDHRNGIGLDNRRENLRPATDSQNKANAPKQRAIKRGTHHSKFKGVTWFERDSVWKAQCSDNGKQKHLGYFKDEEDAARAYDAAALRIFGEFAYINFP